MRVVNDAIWVCADCLLCLCNGDTSGIDSDRRAAAVEEACADMGPHIVPNYDSETGAGMDEFSCFACECCDSPLAGSRHRMALLGEEVAS